MNLNGMVIVKFQLYLFEYSFLKINYSQAQEGILENLSLFEPKLNSQGLTYQGFEIYSHTSIP